jgi:hypothetical protein
MLGRRELRANVDLCPKRARWPEDPVSIRVQLVDPSGRIDPATESLTFETTVNLDAVRVEWHRLGAVWWARLPPQPVLGPSVVRVTARDSRGLPIGEGHLEVDMDRPKQPTGPRGPDTTEVRVIH